MFGSGAILVVDSLYHAKFSRGSDGHLIKTMDSADGNSSFYEAEGVYYLLNTCNTWTAKGLKSTGWKISPVFKSTPGSVMTNLEKNNTVPEIYLCEAGVKMPKGQSAY